MTKKALFVDCGDENLWNNNVFAPMDSTPKTSLANFALYKTTATTGVDKDNSGDIEGSRGGASIAAAADYGLGATLCDSWATDFISYEKKSKFYSVAWPSGGASVQDMGDLTSHHTSLTTTAGICRIAYVFDQIAGVGGQRNLWACVEYMDGASTWQFLGGTAGSGLPNNRVLVYQDTPGSGWQSPYDGHCVWALQGDKSTHKARLLVNGNDVLGVGWVTVPGTTPLNNWLSTPSPGHVSATSKSQGYNYRLSWMAVYEDSAAITPMTADVHARYPRAVGDFAGGGGYGTWAATGIAAGCSSDVWRAIDDAEDLEDGADDYASTPGTSTAWFKPDPLNLDDSTAIGVTMMAVLKSGDGAVSQFKINDGVNTPLAYTPVACGWSSSYKAINLPTAPDGTAWTAAKFNDTEFGIVSSGAGKMWGLIFHVHGVGLTRTAAKAPVCVGATRRRYGMVA